MLGVGGQRGPPLCGDRRQEAVSHGEETDTRHRVPPDALPADATVPLVGKWPARPPIGAVATN